MTPPAVILDCDPGYDDALAIIAAARHCELLGITTVSGNVSLEKTTRNALLTTQILGLDTAVYAGADRPLVADPHRAESIHGTSGLDGITLPPLRRSAARQDAVGFIIDTVRSREDVWLVAIGPLTNVALALRTAPDLASRLKGISIMGGGITFGNATPVAEFNILADPEAADVVFRAPVRRIVAPLDLTHQFRVDEATVSRVKGSAGRAATFAGEILAAYGGAYARISSGPNQPVLHDPCSVLALSHSGLFERSELHLAIELRGEHTRGMTVADRRTGRSRLAANSEVLTAIDSPAALDVLVETVASFA